MLAPMLVPFGALNRISLMKKRELFKPASDDGKQKMLFYQKSKACAGQHVDNRPIELALVVEIPSVEIR